MIIDIYECLFDSTLESQETLMLNDNLKYINMNQTDRTWQTERKQQLLARLFDGNHSYPSINQIERIFSSDGNRNFSQQDGADI